MFKENDMFVLVVNAGSSSLKYQLFDMDTEKVLAKGLCDRITLEGSSISHKNLVNGKEHKELIAMPNHTAATQAMIDALVNADHGVIKSVSDISAVGHRVVQGGPWLTKPTLVTEETFKILGQCIDLAPLHTGPHLEGIKACQDVMGNIPMVMVIDTSFHSTMPDYACTYPIDIKVARKHNIKRYGAHGTSHRYVAQECAKYLDKPVEETKIITCHLGNGSSVTAVEGGKAIDTSMGFTPQEGIVMGTRSGSIDPTIVTYLIKSKGYTAEEVDNILNKKSGLLGITGLSNDCRNVTEAAENGNARAELAIKMLVNSIKKYIGSYIAEMNGVDAIVFTAGIGENQWNIREKVCENMSYLGIEIDADKNKNFERGVPFEISAEGAKVRTWIIPTDEEYMIAIDTERLAKK